MKRAKKKARSRRAHQVLVKMNDGESAIAVELADGATVPSLLRQLLIERWKTKGKR